MADNTFSYPIYKKKYAILDLKYTEGPFFLQ